MRTRLTLRLLACLAWAASLPASHLAHASPLHSASDLLPPLCAPAYQAQHPTDCPSLGPGGYLQQLADAGLAYPLPAVHVERLYPYLGLTPDAYGKVITDAAPVYRHPLEALAGLSPVRRFEKGFVYASLVGQTTVNGQLFYQINPGEYMLGKHIEPARPSTFQGQFFAAPPASLVGWVITTIQPSAEPGQPPAASAAYVGRYQFFTVIDARQVGEWTWYLIGPGQWVEQRMLGLVHPAPPAGAGGDVIAVDTYEQTLGVYQNGQLIYATLVSSGSRYFPTRPGTFKVWARLTHGKMSGAYREDRSDYYFLEDVPWILYYDGDRALHGAYWHDHFGVRSSHGCVNLSPRDARWLYDFARTGSSVVIFSSPGPVAR